MRRRHRASYWLAGVVSRAIFPWKLGFSCETAQNLPERYIVLANHVTDFDPFLVGLSFPRAMYYVASEHVSRWGFLSKALKFCFDPVLRSKGTVAAATAKEILRRSWDGDNICLFAEGNRSWDGRTCSILPSTGKLVQKCRCALVTYKLTGGYFVSPRWSRRPRKGPFYGAVVQVYSQEEVAAMTTAEVNAVICRDLFEDAYARQLADPQPYRGKALAEGMENLLFLCPQCGAQDSLLGGGSHVRCQHCGLDFTYDQFGMLTGAPFDNLRDFSDWQKVQVAQHTAAQTPYTGEFATLTTVSHAEATPVDEGPVTMTPEALTCGSTTIPLADISTLDIHGARGVVFTAGKHYYELRPRGNGLKYCLYYNAVKNPAANP